MYKCLKHIDGISNFKITRTVPKKIFEKLLIFFIDLASLKRVSLKSPGPQKG